MPEYQPDPSFGVMKYLDISTAHITRHDDELLTSESDHDPQHARLSLLGVHVLNPGYLVYVDPDDLGNGEWIQKFSDAGFSMGLLLVLKAAMTNECVWVRLDPDGPKYDNLPEFKWGDE